MKRLLIALILGMSIPLSVYAQDKTITAAKQENNETLAGERYRIDPMPLLKQSYETAVPVLVGAKYSVLPGIYGTAAIGLNFISTSAEATVNYMGFSSSASSTESETKFGYSIGAGAQVMMFDVSLKYQSLASDGNFVALTVLYNIGI